MRSDKCIPTCAFNANSRQRLFLSSLVLPQAITSPPQSQLPVCSRSLCLFYYHHLNHAYVLYRLLSTHAIFHNFKMSAVFCPLKLETNAKDLPARVSWCES